MKVDIDVKDAPAAAGGSGVGKSSIPGVKHVIAVASGKGGVGIDLRERAFFDGAGIAIADAVETPLQRGETKATQATR